MIQEIRQIIADRWAQELKIRAWRRAIRNGPTAIANTRHGRLTVYTSDDTIGRILFTEGEYEFDLMTASTEVLRRAGKLVPKGQGVLLDIGANIGLTATGMLTAGEFAQVVSFEPEPRNFSLLQKNVADNGFANRVTAFNVALSDREGTLDFELSETNFGDHRVRVGAVDGKGAALHGEAARNVIRVPARPLDAVVDSLPEGLRQDLRLIWIDVQGHEEHVFRGASRLLSTGIPVAAEFWPYGLQRAGSTRESYCGLAREYWTDCWVYRGSRFICYPIAALGAIWDEFAQDASVGNLLFTR